MRTYSEDYAGWAEDTAQAIAEGRWDEIDREALAEEVHDLSNSSRREAQSALRIILVHLLKSKYQPLKYTRRWELTVLEHRRRVHQFFEESPSLRARQAWLIERAYGDARLRAANETGLELETFPEACEFSAADILGN